MTPRGDVRRLTHQARVTSFGREVTTDGIRVTFGSACNGVSGCLRVTLEVTTVRTMEPSRFPLTPVAKHAA